MELQSIDMLGNSSIGIFSVATNTFSIVPFNLKQRSLNLIGDTLKVPLIQTSVANSNLIGLFAVGNSTSLLLPGLINDDEYGRLKENLPETVELGILESKITALGNAVVCAENAVLAHKEFSKGDCKYLENFFDLEVIPIEINNSPLVGSLIFKNDNGFLTHPLISDEELDWISSILKLDGDVVTVNRGMPFPRPGIVANNHGILVGSDTTGPEIMRIYDILAN